jgi:hypothetical protein
MRTFSVILVGFVLIWAFFTCAGSNKRQVVTNSNNTTIVADTEAADGLDLKALAAMLKGVKDGEDLERQLNQENGINNLDLNEDGKVDFIKVTEFGEPKKSLGYSLTTEPVKGEEQEIATIQITNEGETANVEVSGNQQIYGSGHHYHSSPGIGTWLLLGYMMGGNYSFYRSPYYYGYYPRYYRPYSPISRSSYYSRSSAYYKNSNFTRTAAPRISSLSNPNRGKVANKGITKNLKSPTASQKTFASRNPNKAARTGGFGRKSTSSRSSSSSVKGRSSSRGFGGRGK